MDNQIFRPSRNKLKDYLVMNKRRRSMFSTPLLLISILILLIAFFILGKAPDLTAQEENNYVTSKSNHTKISFTGDVSPSRFLKEVTKKYGNDVFYRGTKQVWADSDISLVNLESVVVENDLTVENYPELELRQGKILLDTTKEDVKAIKDSGIKLIGFANNHSQDFGVRGMQETFAALDELGLNRIGAGININEAIKPYTETFGDTKVSITALTDKLPLKTTGGGNIPRVFTASHLYLDYELGNTFSHNDFNIVYIHWGTEYALKPEGHIRELGQKLIDLGADLVIGSHPHVLLPVEKYKDGAIVYSMGNFVFDQTIGRTAYSAIGSLYFNNEERFLEFVPVQLKNGIPFIQEEDSKIFDKVTESITKNLEDSDFEIKDGKIIIWY